MNTKLNSFFILAGLALGLMSCDKTQKTGWEFAPNMYNSVAYESMTQIEKNNINPGGMNMRLPVEGTIARRNFNTSFAHGDSAIVNDIMAYDLDRNNPEAADNLVNPVPKTDAAIAEGKTLYLRNCSHCHGKNGEADGPVADIYNGVPTYGSDAVKVLSQGRIFHVITYGKGRMWPHAAQVNPEERWKIARFVETLQK